MRLSELETFEELVEERRRNDLEFRLQWDRFEFAREVANRVIQYRVDHDLSQRKFAMLVGLAQPQVARLEKAEHQPSVETLARLTLATGLKFAFVVANGRAALAPNRSRRSRKPAEAIVSPRRRKAAGRPAVAAGGE